MLAVFEKSTFCRFWKAWAVPPGHVASAKILVSNGVQPVHVASAKLLNQRAAGICDHSAIVRKFGTRLRLKAVQPGHVASAKILVSNTWGAAWACRVCQIN